MVRPGDLTSSSCAKLTSTSSCVQLTSTSGYVKQQRQAHVDKQQRQAHLRRDLGVSLHLGQSLRAALLQLPDLVTHDAPQVRHLPHRELLQPRRQRRGRRRRQLRDRRLEAAGLLDEGLQLAAGGRRLQRDEGRLEGGLLLGELAVALPPLLGNLHDAQALHTSRAPCRVSAAPPRAGRASLSNTAL